MPFRFVKCIFFASFEIGMVSDVRAFNAEKKKKKTENKIISIQTDPIHCVGHRTQVYSIHKMRMMLIKKKKKKTSC